LRSSLSKLREFIESANEQLIVRVKPRVEDASVIAFRKSLYWIRDSVNLLYDLAEGRFVGDADREISCIVRFDIFEVF
jgi:hypothetical protein